MKRRSDNILNIVRLSQMLKKWRKNTSSSSSSSSSSSTIINTKSIPSDVPPGHVAVHAGNNNKRYILRAKYLNHPVFRNLLRKAEEEYGGFDINYDGPIFIPCDELDFQEALRVVTRSLDCPSRCRVGGSENVPLLHGLRV